jgi:Glutamate dehydrogenase/leucine dehydrogenase
MTNDRLESSGLETSELSPVPVESRTSAREDRVNGRMKELMEASTDATLSRANENAISHRTSAYENAIERVAEAGHLRGWH